MMVSYFTRAATVAVAAAIAAPAPFASTFAIRDVAAVEQVRYGFSASCAARCTNNTCIQLSCSGEVYAESKEAAEIQFRVWAKAQLEVQARQQNATVTGGIEIRSKR